MKFRRVYSKARQTARRVFDRFPMVDRLVAGPLRGVVHRVERSVIARDLKSPAMFEGFAVHFRPEDTPLLLSQLDGDYESETRSRIEAMLGQGDTFVDVGANIGFFTLLGSRRVGLSGRVIAFEAMPATAAVLATNVRENGLTNVVVNASAVLDRSCTAVFEVDEYSSGGSGLADAAAKGVRSRLEVEAVSLDDFFAARAWPTIRLVKIDVEGAEVAALGGMRELCRRQPQLQVIVEVNERLHSLALLSSTLREIGLTRTYALELGRPVTFPQDIELIRMSCRQLTINLLCSSDDA